MVHPLDQQQHHHSHGRESEAHHIAGELLSGRGFSQARSELTNEFTRNPREAQRLLHQIGGELRAHGYRGVGVELDRHHNVTHVDFNHHNIYQGLGHGDYHPYTGHHHRHEGQGPGHGQFSRHHQHDRDESFAPPGERGRPHDYQNHREIPSPFEKLGRNIQEKLDETGHAIGDKVRELGHDLEGLSHKLGDRMASMAASVAERLGTYNDCAHGPRLVFDRMGFHLPPMMATEQGRQVASRPDLWEKIPESEVRRGDYGVRNWSSHVVHQHGYNAGDSFIVLSNHHGNIVQANDHIQGIDRRGRYRDVAFYRPTPKLIEMAHERGLV